jgi:hypothetical protein
MNSFQKNQKKSQLKSDISEYLDNSFLDISSTGTSNCSNFTEAYLAKLLTRIAVGSATVWWSVLELKDLVSTRKKYKRKFFKNERS